MKPSLCLGTAQFGLNYGVTNRNGQVPVVEVGQILGRAEEYGIHFLDTAQAYGNAESMLGCNLNDDHKFSIISKFPPQSKKCFDQHDIESWDKSFHESLNRLKISSLNTFLMHSPADLLKAGSLLLQDWLLGLRAAGFVRRLGVSIYDSKDLIGINPEILDLVQIPLSLYDQRLINDGTVERLRSNGTAVHARSLYLQGLLLAPSESWPQWIPSEVRNHQQALEKIAAKKNCRLVDLALGFAMDQTDLEAIVIGICDQRQLEDLYLSWSKNSPWVNKEWKNWPLQDCVTIDPRLWPDS